MALTRAQLVDRVRQQANAVNSTKDWTPDLVMLYLDAVLQHEYDQILDAAPHWRTATREVAVPTDRRLALTDFDSGAGDDEQITHRVLQLSLGTTSAGNRPRKLEYIDPWKVDLTQSKVPSGYWTVDNEEIVVGAAEDDASQTSVTALVAHTPPLPTELEGDESEIALPRGYELVVVLMGAAEMLGKAGRDTQQALELESRADRFRGQVLSRLSGRFGGPRRMEHDVDLDGFPT